MAKQPRQGLSKQYIRARLVRYPIYMVIGFLIFAVFNRYQSVAIIGFMIFCLSGCAFVVGGILYLIAALLRRE